MNFGRETPGRVHLASENQAAAHRLRASLFDASASTDLTALRRLAGRVAEAIANRQRHLDQIERKLQATVPEDAEDIVLDAATERRIEDLQADIRAIRSGIEPETGLTSGTLDTLRGLPGLDELDGMAERLAARIAAVEVRQNTTWPRSFRYVGPRLRHHLGKRYAKPGEIVALTEQQAEAFAERFEAVEQEAPQTST